MRRAQIPLRRPFTRCARGTFGPSARTQELNRQKSGFSSSAVARSIAAHVEWLNGQIKAVMEEARHIIATDATLSRNLELVRGITGFGGVAEGSVRVAHGIATEVRLRQPSCWPSSLRWHSIRCTAGTLTSVVIPTATPPEPSTTPPAPPNIADFTPKALAAFVGLSPPAYSTGFAGGTLNGSARKLLIYAHAVIRTQKAFNSLRMPPYPLDPQHGISGAIPRPDGRGAFDISAHGKPPEGLP